ncbi:MAG TPA: ubiquitin-like domain-containing protein [Actinomycetota bacterium]
MVGLLLLTGVIHFALQKHVTLVVDGRQVAVQTTSSNVRDLLAGEGISLSARFQVQPPPATQLADGMTVVVSPAPVAPGFDVLMASEDPTVLQSPTDVGVWVMAGTSAGSASLADQLVESSFSASSVGTSPAVPVQVVVLGKVRDVLTNAGTAGELLSAMGIHPDADDRVLPSPSTPLHQASIVRFDQVEVTTEVRQVTIPAPVHTEFRSTMVPGTVRVLEEGRDGRAVGTFRAITINGQVARERLIGRWIEREAITERRLSGPESMYGGTTQVPGTDGASQTGLASWYDPPWSGITAAHPTLPFGTLVTVTDVETGLSVTVVIDDRGPFAPGKIIDLSPEAFQILRPLGTGVIDVRLTW